MKLDSDTHVQESIQHGSDERRALLTELASALKVHAVPASFWACLQMSDLSALKSFVQQAKVSYQQALLLWNSFDLIPRLWMLRVFCLSDTREAVERDKRQCVLTGFAPAFAYEIFPDALKIDSLPEFWELLPVLFDRETVCKWKEAAFPDPANPTTCIPQHLISLSPNLYHIWSKGLCAFKPISVSADQKELEIEFHWLPREAHGPLDDVNLDQTPLSSAGLEGVDGAYLHAFKGPLIKTGDRFLLTTENPETHPLPSFPLLEMSFKLSWIVSLSAVKEPSWGQEDVDSHPLEEDIDSLLAEERRLGNIYGDDDEDYDFFFFTNPAGETVPEVSASTARTQNTPLGTRQMSSFLGLFDYSITFSSS
ncbi:uncharacterized protein LDX57_011797 [Aspergillus melleus]|uniref:uncharacterized protein n=1 Tax=Aspergillus melleus TaxID=138277 RepID=UPI001E8D43AE|nr:uncharacterized protein LDX57_011797 [Aspergillus melleus]KAH8434159.1 hypothetical protein LDX57_011797 [Aspergillus melleus]